MRIGILSPKQEENATPYRHVPKRVVKLLVAAEQLIMITKSLAREIRTIPSSDYDRLIKPGIIIIPKLLPPIPPSNLDLYYPNPRYFVANCGILRTPLSAEV